MPQRPAHQFMCERFGNCRRSAVFEIRAGCTRIIFCAFRFGIEPNHSCFVESAFKFTQRGDCRCWKREPKQEHGVVARKKLQIVFKRDQMVLGDLRVRRISIFHIDRTLFQRGIPEGMIDADNVLRIQLVTPGKRSPSVLSIQEFVGESEL